MDRVNERLQLLEKLGDLCSNLGAYPSAILYYEQQVGLGKELPVPSSSFYAVPLPHPFNVVPPPHSMLSLLSFYCCMHVKINFKVCPYNTLPFPSHHPSSPLLHPFPPPLTSCLPFLLLTPSFPHTIPLPLTPPPPLTPSLPSSSPSHHPSSSSHTIPPLLLPSHHPPPFPLAPSLPPPLTPSLPLPPTPSLPSHHSSRHSYLSLKLMGRSLKPYQRCTTHLPPHTRTADSSLKP